MWRKTTTAFASLAIASIIWSAASIQAQVGGGGSISYTEPSAADPRAVYTDGSRPMTGDLFLADGSPAVSTNTALLRSGANRESGFLVNIGAASAAALSAHEASNSAHGCTSIASTAALAAHIASTGTSVHGLGTISTQNANAVAITGGTASFSALAVSGYPEEPHANATDWTATSTANYSWQHHWLRAWCNQGDAGALATYTNGPAHGKGTYVFWGGVLMPNGKVCLVPNSSANVGIYDGLFAPVAAATLLHPMLNKF